MELQHDRTIQSRDDRSSIRITNMMKDKYRQMPEITSEEMIQGYIPSPRIHLTDTFLTIPSRRPRFDHSTQLILRPDYSDLCLMNYHTDSAWIRYNEQRIEQLQQRINLMLQIDENEEAQLLLPTSSPIQPTVATVTQRIDDALMISPRYPHQLIHRGKKNIFCSRLKQHFHLFCCCCLASPCRYRYRLHRSVPNSPRSLTRNVTRSTTPVSKSVRISTQSVPSPTHSRPSPTSTPRPIVSILRRSSVPAVPRPSQPLVESSHVWTSKVDGKTYVLEQFSIPRYYRLYNDASFREMYQFSRMLDTYLDSNETPRKDYSTMVKNFAVDQQLPSEITSVA